MDFREIHDRFGDVLSFHGTIGTQTTMPFSTPDDVRRQSVRKIRQVLDCPPDVGDIDVYQTVKKTTLKYING